jgi:hypothetical protein
LQSLCHSSFGFEIAVRPRSIGSSSDGTAGGGKIISFNQLTNADIPVGHCHFVVHLFSKVRLPPAADGSSSIGTASGGKIIQAWSPGFSRPNFVALIRLSMIRSCILRFICCRTRSVPGRLYEMPHLRNLRLT